MSVGGRVYSSFSTPGQLIPTVSSEGSPSVALIPNVYLKNTGNLTNLPVDGEFAKVLFDTVSRNVLVNVDEEDFSTIELLESGTYSISFSAFCDMPPLSSDYLSIYTDLELSSVGDPTNFVLYRRFTLYPISNSLRGHVYFSLIETLLAGQFLRFTAAAIGSSSPMQYGTSSAEQATTLSIVKIAPYYVNN